MLIGRIAIIPPELVTSTGSIHEDIQGIIVKRIAPHAIIPSNRRAAYREASERERLNIARVVYHSQASGPWVISLPALHTVILHSGAYRTIENDTARATRRTEWRGAEYFVVSEAHVFDAWVEERSVACVADFVVFDFGAIGLDAVAL